MRPEFEVEGQDSQVDLDCQDGRYEPSGLIPTRSRATLLNPAVGVGRDENENRLRDYILRWGTYILKYIWDTYGIGKSENNSAEARSANLHMTEAPL